VDLKIYDNSKNYTCQVIKLPPKKKVNGLDNLVEVTYQGNSVLVGKDSPEDLYYLFFPAECQISDSFLKKNNLYRHHNMNEDPNQKGFFEDNRRVKAIKFKGVISSGFIMPVTSLMGLNIEDFGLNVGDEFNEINGVEICRKYVRRQNPGKTGFENPRTKVLDEVVDSKMAPEHMDTAHLMKNLHKLDLDTRIVVSYKLHGTSARIFNTLVKRKLNLKEKIAKWLGVKVVEEDYDYVSASRRVVKSVGFEELPGKQHYFKDGDLWSEFAKKNFKDQLNKGEAVYFEIVGKTYNGEAIQSGYTYGFDEPIGYIYRISNINPQGIEVDLSYEQMVERGCQMGMIPCPELFNGTVKEFIQKYDPTGFLVNSTEDTIENIFYNILLEKPSILDSSVVEEGFCVRIDQYPKPFIFKIKSKKFLAHESKALDAGTQDIEEEQSNTNESTSDN